MKILILCSDDVFAGLLSQPLFRRRSSDIAQVLIQEDIMMPGRGPVQLLRQVARHSGWHYALYQGIELVCYGAAERTRGFLSRGNVEGDFLTRPSRLAHRWRIPVSKVSRINEPETVAQVRELAPDLILSLRFSQIMKRPFLEIPPLGVLNFHPSMLPFYAGLGSVFQAMYRGERQVGCTAHLVDEGIDTGKVVVQEAVGICPGDSVSRVCLKVYLRGGYTLLKAVEMMETGFVDLEEKGEKGSYYSWPGRQEVDYFRRSGGHLLRLKDLLRISGTAGLEQAL